VRKVQLMKNFDFSKLDEIIHSKIRLGIMCALINVDEAEFNYLKKNLNVTDGNLSVHLKKLEESEYIKVEKKFVNRKPQSTYQLTSKGKKAFKSYIELMESLVSK
jgi:DNA-binding HxlR family transcriptional regulator